MDLDTNNNSVFKLSYHLLLVIKYRRKVINDYISNRLTEISKFLNDYKSASSRLIKKEYPSIRKQLWKEYFWSRSYCLLTTGSAPIEVVKKIY
ncbi:transposase [Clostridium perfringens]|uniref:transposase n=1 Tax=Clostridium perfringens TaxID=1502 RepID=UPI001C8601DE|nr:transposase [Clostridium perfringens]EGT0693255.1 transposase [Clostridium perfringens]MDK0572836.1 transposase [Clostridium perfringens]